MSAFIYAMVLCVTMAGMEPRCERLNYSDNRYDSLEACQAGLDQTWPKTLRDEMLKLKTKQEVFCAKKDVPVWTRAN